MHLRESRIGLHHAGAGKVGEHAEHKRLHVFRAKRAVDADSIGTERGERHGSDFRRRAEEGTPVLSECHGHECRQLRMLLDRKEGSLRLGEVCHRLDHEEVGSCLFCRDCLFGKEPIGLFELHGPHGLEEGSRGADIRRDIARSCCTHAGDGCLEDLAYGRLAGKLQGIRAERVRRHGLGTSLDVSGMDGCDIVRIFKAEELWQLSCLHATFLELRSHGSIEEEELLPFEHVGEMLVLDSERALGTRSEGGRCRHLRVADSDRGQGPISFCHGRSFPGHGMCRNRGRRTWRSSCACFSSVP